jgi:hypothetical protein
MFGGQHRNDARKRAESQWWEAEAQSRRPISADFGADAEVYLR